MKTFLEYNEQKQMEKLIECLSDLYFNSDIQLNESMLDGKTNGRTWWGDIKHHTGSLGVSLKGLFVAGIASISAGLRKFWNWLGGSNEKRIKDNNNIWPGWFSKNKNDFSSKTYDKSKIKAGPVEYKKVKDLVMQTNFGVKQTNEVGFGDYIQNVESFVSDKNIKISDIFWFTATYKANEILYIYGYTPEKLEIQNNTVSEEKTEDVLVYSTVCCLKFANDIVKFMQNDEYILRSIIENARTLNKKHKKDATGVAFHFFDKINVKILDNIGFKKIKDSDMYYIDNDVDIINKKVKPKQTTNEDLDADNLMWKLDKWFETREDEKQTFYEMIAKYNQTVDVKDLTKDIKNTKLEETLKEFVNFMYDDFDFSTEKDYLYQLKKIIEYIKGKKVDLK